LWIPTHILTFNIKYFKDYKNAGIPTFPSTYGYQNTRIIIAISALGAALAIIFGAFGLGLAWGYLRLIAVFSIGILGLSVFSIINPSEKVNFGLFKYASLYMMGSMLMFVLGVLQ